MSTTRTTSIEVIRGDITKAHVDAIVNAANTSLLGGGGVDGAIHRAAGPILLEECRNIRNRQGGCAVGDAVLTSAGNLPARFVIHAVGPVWNGGNSSESELLARAYLKSLEIANDNGLRSIAFPNISTGTYQFPKARAVDIVLSTVTEFLRESRRISRIVFVCLDEENYQLYRKRIPM